MPFSTKCDVNETKIDVYIVTNKFCILFKYSMDKMASIIVNYLNRVLDQLSCIILSLSLKFYSCLTSTFILATTQDSSIVISIYVEILLMMPFTSSTYVVLLHVLFIINIL